MGQLVVLFITLTVVTLVGHLIWVVVAAFGRALFGTSDGEGTAARIRCPTCGYSNPTTVERCAWCSRPLPANTAGELDDLAAFRRQLARLRERSVVEPETVDNLLARVNEYEDRLIHPPPVP